jgi:hypothetical protein
LINIFLKVELYQWMINYTSFFECEISKLKVVKPNANDCYLHLNNVFGYLFSVDFHTL